MAKKRDEEKIALLQLASKHLNSYGIFPDDISYTGENIWNILPMMGSVIIEAWIEYKMEVVEKKIAPLKKARKIFVEVVVRKFNRRLPGILDTIRYGGDFVIRD